MITFYQQLAPDEHHYTYIAGLFQKSGWKEPKDFLKATVASAGLCVNQGSYTGYSNHIFPNVLRGLIGTVIDEDQFRPDTLNILTLLPYYRPFLLPVQQKNLFKESSFTVASRSERRPHLPQGNGTSFRYCVTCMQDAYERYGRVVLLRAHQLPCVFVCWQHRVPLRTVEIDVDNLAIPDFRLSREKCVSRVSEEHLWLAIESRKLLHLNRGFTSPVEKIHAMYSYEELTWDAKERVTFVLRENRARKKGNAKEEGIWAAGWSKSLVNAFERELSSYSQELRDTYYSPWLGRFKVGRTSPIGSPIEHLMRIRRFEGGIEEFFRKVDEVSRFKVEAFFPAAYKRHGHGLVPYAIAVTPQADFYLKKLAKEMGAGLGDAMDKICGLCRDHVAKLQSPADFQSSGASRDIYVTVPMSVDSFVFIDRLASRNGTGGFAATAGLLIEYAQRLRG